jgi:hypothetical protein
MDVSPDLDSQLQKIQWVSTILVLVILKSENMAMTLGAFGRAWQSFGNVREDFGNV